ncbi:unnamed protein product [Bursaphelenchus xylophilus]|uniref:(pine wood nematode) hypothetical protein n=1 Tax=Bursaphelenchus xylophilus TaxID=6326 RepID=A0A1I7RYU1_BURXY|nr:unnamed protein product [Bursaphelenchus xylophilus]CAG9092225.1 unnamed protein product [Bursaphelenchus xylophilus]
MKFVSVLAVVAVALYAAVVVEAETVRQYCEMGKNYVIQHQGELADTAKRQQLVDKAKSLIQQYCGVVNICGTPCANTAINCLNRQRASSTLIAGIDSCCSQC